MVTGIARTQHSLLASFEMGSRPRRAVVVWRGRHRPRGYSERRGGTARWIGLRPESEVEELRALLFENDLGLFSFHFLLAEGAGNIAERWRRRKCRTEFPKRPFSLGVGVGTAPNERNFARHIVLGGMPRMVGNYERLRFAGQDLPEGGGGKENEHGK